MPEILKGDILFIEDSFVDAAITERNMSVLKNANILEKVSCIIVGLIENYNDLGSKRKYHEILLEFLDKDVPIIYNFPCSHIQPSTILKIGALMEINNTERGLTFEN